MHDASNPVKTLIRRVAVIGRAGAGKTTLALRLGEALDLPAVHLDRLFWGPGWKPVPSEEFDRLEAAAIAEDRWVIDGGYLSSPGWSERVRRADVIVLVEAPLPVCLWRVIRRSLRRSGVRRPDLPDGCSEEFSAYFLWWSVGWTRRHRSLTSDIRRMNPSVRIVRAGPGFVIDEVVDAWEATRPEG